MIRALEAAAKLASLAASATALLQAVAVRIDGDFTTVGLGPGAEVRPHANWHEIGNSSTAECFEDAMNGVRLGSSGVRLRSSRCPLEWPAWPSPEGRRDEVIRGVFPFGHNESPKGLTCFVRDCGGDSGGEGDGSRSESSGCC